MATFVGRFRKLFAQKKQRLPSFIEVDVDPRRQWNILEDIGEGSFGAVKKVSRRTDPSQIAAFKCTEVQEGEEVEDLAIEVEILLVCKHENVVGILAAYYHDNCLSVMLEYCAGGAVDQIMIELDKALTENQIACIARQTCTGLSFLHAKYIIHRDLKAGNLLLAADGLVKIADFGVSCMLNSAEEGSNTFIGTPHWMSPEVIRCETMTNQLYNGKADIWSLGITCIQLAQKEPPYHEMSAERVRLKILRSTRPPTLDNPNVHSTAFRDFVSRSLVLNPDERCTSADLLTHPFIVNATDKKPLMVLLLEMSADLSEEPVFDTSNSCANSICSSDGTSIWSRTDETMNSSLDSETSKNNGQVNGKPVVQHQIDHEKTPVVEVIQSKKKRAAPAPPPQQRSPSPPAVTVVQRVNELDEEELPIEKTPVEEMKFVYVNTPGSKDAEIRDLNGHLSPSSKAMEEILDDLNDVLDENYCHSSSESRSPSQGSSASLQKRKKLDRPRLDSNPNNLREAAESFSRAKNQFENGKVSPEVEECTIIRCGTPTQSIKNLAKTYSTERKSPIHSHSRVTSTDSEYSVVSRASIPPTGGNQPLLLRVNADEDDHDHDDQNNEEMKRHEEAAKRVTEAIPSGLVKRNRELAEREQMVDHARDAAQKIKEQRKKEDAAIFGEQRQVSKIAASLSSKIAAAEISENEPVDHAPESSFERKATNDHEKVERLPSITSSGDSKKVLSNQAYNYFGDENAKVQIVKEAPPPEPPPDYDETPKAAIQPKFTAAVSDSTPRARPPKGHVTINKSVDREKENDEPKKEGMVRRTPNRQTATKRTRTFTLDGIQVTSTSTQLLKNKQNYEWRKQQEREYLRMQRGEARQRNEHEKKSAILQDQQERAFMAEKLNLEKAYQSDIDVISKVQKKKIEEIERAQEDEIKQQAKRLRSDQERQIKNFREQLAREQKQLKQESEQIPKPQRKEFYRVRKDHLDASQAEREIKFLERLDREHEMFLEQLRSGHRERITLTERALLEQRQSIEQSMMSAIWELEERQLTERHNLNTQQLKELYLLQRAQMMARHQKEKEFVRNQIANEEDQLLRDLSTNRKNLPKSLRTESKARIKMFKESLHIKYAHIPEKWDQLMKKFQEEEKDRVKRVIEDYESKYAKRAEILREDNRILVKELEQIHSEKKKMLCDNEQQMVNECEQQFQILVSEARSARPLKKSELESRFKNEMEKQLKFYNVPSNSA